MRGALTGLFLPPLLLVLGVLAAGLLAWRGRRGGGLAAAFCAALLLLLATPFAAGHLAAALDDLLPGEPSQDAPAPAAIVVLGAEQARTQEGYDIGPLTLERLRAGVALHRRTGLPLLVTGGPLSAGAPPVAEMMAMSLATEFGVAARWVEPRARDTRENALLAAALLHAEGIGAALVVSHGWHLPRALDAFARAGLPAAAAPVRRARRPEGRPSDWLPRPDHLAQSWLMLREAAGLLVYRLRDGRAPAP